MLRKNAQNGLETISLILFKKSTKLCALSIFFQFRTFVLIFLTLDTGGRKA